MSLINCNIPMRLAINKLDGMVFPLKN